MKPELRYRVLFKKLAEYVDGDQRFIRAKIWIAHTGANVNGSFFDKPVLQDAVPTLSNIPIVAMIKDQDFSAHGEELTKDEDGNDVIKYCGHFYGVIPETNNADFEMRMCDDGIEREFLTAEGILWTQKDDATGIISDTGIRPQSMELCDDYEGEQGADDLFHFTKITFKALCMLGEGVEPAMKSSTIEIQDYAVGENQLVQDNLNKFTKISSQPPSTEKADAIQFAISELKNIKRMLNGGRTDEQQLVFQELQQIKSLIGGKRNG